MFVPFVVGYFNCVYKVKSSQPYGTKHHRNQHCCFVYSKYQNKISKQKNKETFANLASLLQSFEIGKNNGEDLIYFIEDDYLHFEPMLEEMVASYERIASQINKDIFMCPTDYPYL